MKILIVGEYGFFCNHLAERLEREGNEIYIVNRKRGDKKNKLLCKHVHFQCELSSSKLEDIFKGILPNAVIFLGAQDEGFWQGDYNKAENEFLSGLINVLKNARLFKVNKFIFLSSDEVYTVEENKFVNELEDVVPATIRGNILIEAESLCERWEKSYGLNSLSVRMPEIYGPRQYEISQNSFVMGLIEKILYEKTVKIHKEKTHPLLYIGDATDAIYRALGSTVSKKMNIASGEFLNEEEILHIIEDNLGKKAVNIEYINENNPTAILDSTISQKELDWIPLYDIRKGIEKTVSWINENSDSLFEKPKQSNKAENEKVKERWKKIYPYLENIILFSLISYLTVTLRYNPILAHIDITMLYIVLMAVMFGVKQASIAVILSSGLYMGQLIQNGSDLVGALLNFQTMLRVSQYFLIGISIGYTLDRRKVELAMKEEELDFIQAEFNDLEEIYNENLRIKESLEERLISHEDSFGKIYSMVSRLDVLQSERIIPSAINVLMEIMKSKNVAIYSASSQGNYLRLAASSTKEAAQLGKSLPFDTLGALGKDIKKQKIFTNRSMKEELPTMAAGIYYEGQLIYAIFIWNAPFEIANLYYVNLLRTVASLISSSLNRAYKYMEATSDSKYVINTRVLKSNIFEEIIHAKKIAKELEVSEYSILQIDYGNELEKISSNILNIIRDTDYLGLDNNGRLLALLSNSTTEDSNIVVNRIREKNLICSVVTI